MMPFMVLYRYFIHTNFNQFRISHFTAIFCPSGPIGTMSDRVYLGFMPIETSDIPSTPVCVTPVFVQAMPYSASCGMVGYVHWSFMPLRLMARLINFLTLIQTWFFVVCYKDLTRNEYIKFNARDFQCQIFYLMIHGSRYYPPRMEIKLFPLMTRFFLYQIPEKKKLKSLASK